MTTYDAIIHAADFIERHPQNFCFSKALVPTFSDCCGCALGWIGYFSVKDYAGTTVDIVAQDALGIPYRPSIAAMEFYAIMATLSPGWRDDAARCAQGLRSYATKYHGIPESVREIFETPVAA